MSRSRELRLVTRLFPAFLGLRMLPVGLFFLVVGLASSVAGRLPTAVQAVLVLGATAAIWPIHRWYRREFGRVEPERLSLGRNWMIVAGLGLAVAGLGVGAHRFGDVGTQVLVLVVVFFVTAVLFALPRAFGGGAGGVVGLAAIVLLAVGAMLVAGSDPVRFNYLGSIFSLALGVILCVAGVIEHRLLTRVFDRLGTPGDV